MHQPAWPPLSSRPAVRNDFHPDHELKNAHPCPPRCALVAISTSLRHKHFNLLKRQETRFRDGIIGHISDAPIEARWIDKRVLRYGGAVSRGPPMRSAFGLVCTKTHPSAHDSGRTRDDATPDSGRRCSSWSRTSKSESSAPCRRDYRHQVSTNGGLSAATVKNSSPTPRLNGLHRHAAAIDLIIGRRGGFAAGPRRHMPKAEKPTSIGPARHRAEAAWLRRDSRLQCNP